jgi:hypothetical protein
LVGERLAVDGWRGRGASLTSDEPSSSEPQLGDRREFNVLNSSNTFDKVNAVIRRITPHALVYLDEDAPAGGYLETDLDLFAAFFEDYIYPTVTEGFGGESDLDGNGRVIILLTPAVNRLTSDETEGFIGGFFFGVDLMPASSGSNNGEIFYAVVPDAAGAQGPALPRATVMAAVPAILAHEFEHMVHFNQRILLGQAGSQEALWLSEALAQMAEDMVGWQFLRDNEVNEAERFWAGNHARAKRYLQEPAPVSVLASLPPGTLAERGAGWLFLKCLSEQDGREGFLKSLTTSTLTGVSNVTQASGKGWGSLLADWFGGLFLDGLNVSQRPELQCDGIELKDVIKEVDGTYSLKAENPGDGSFARQVTLASSAPSYFLLFPPASGGVALGVSGPDGRRPETAMGLEVLVVRMR